MNQFGNPFYSYVPSARSYSNAADLPDIKSYITRRVYIFFSSNLGFHNSTWKFLDLITPIKAITRF